MTINEKSKKSQTNKFAGRANGGGATIFAPSISGSGTYSDLIAANMSTKQTKAMMNLLDTLQSHISNSFVEFGDAMNKRFEKVDKQFAEARAETNNRFDKVDARLDKAKVDTDKQFAEARAETNNRLDKVDARLDKAKVDTDKQFAEVNKQSSDLRLFMEKEFVRARVSSRYTNIFLGVMLAVIMSGNSGGFFDLLLKFFG